MARLESEFPTIKQLRDCLSELIDQGLGGLPVQILVVPDSTLQVIARASGYEGGKPAIMVDLNAGGTGLPVGLISAERLAERGMPTTVHQ